MLYVFSFLFKFLFPLEISRTSEPNYITKESGQSILVVVVYDAIMRLVEQVSLITLQKTAGKAFFVVVQ